MNLWQIMNSEKMYIQQRRLIEKIRKSAARYLGRSKTIYVWDRTPYYREMWKKAAQRRNMQFVELANDIWELRDNNGKCFTRINNCYVELDNPVTLHIAGHKAVTYALLSDAGLPVPANLSFTLDSLDKLAEFVRNQPGPLVVKPASNTGSGLGITTHLNTYRGCVKAAALASLYGPELLVEQFVAGEVYRLLFVGAEFVSGVRRNGLRIDGDGKSTLSELIRAVNPDLVANWRNDLDLQTTTRLQGFDESTVLAAGQNVLVKSAPDTYEDNIEIRTVYTEDVTSELCSDIIEEARQAARVLRSELCGIDLILLDPKRSLRDGNGIIGEVNTTPGMHHHYNLPGYDPQNDAADVVLEHIRRKCKNG